MSNGMKTSNLRANTANILAKNAKGDDEKNDTSRGQGSESRVLG
jgi:hypothetical protein